jgi:hypothetical protein
MLNRAPGPESLGSLQGPAQVGDNTASANSAAVVPRTTAVVERENDEVCIRLIRCQVPVARYFEERRFTPLSKQQIYHHHGDR